MPVHPSEVFCSSPGRALLRFTSHRGDGLVLLFSFVWLWFFGWVVWWCFCCWCCFVVWFAWSFSVIRNSMRLDSILPCSLVRNVCLPRSSIGPIVFLLGVVSVSPVSPVSPAAKGTCLAVVFCLCGVFFFVVFGCFCLVFFVFVASLCFLHALALSLTGA